MIGKKMNYQEGIVNWGEGKMTSPSDRTEKEVPKK